MKKLHAGWYTDYSVDISHDINVVLREEYDLYNHEKFLVHYGRFFLTKLLLQFFTDEIPPSDKKIIIPLDISRYDYVSEHIFLSSSYANSTDDDICPYYLVFENKKEYVNWKIKR